MCRFCDTAFSRRTFAGLAMGLGAALIARPAKAAGVENLAITCMDFRVVDETCRWLDSKGLTDQYDLVSLAGASLAATSPQFPSSNAAFWDHLAIAKALHQIKKVIVIDHRDCGAFKVTYNLPVAMTHDEETELHRREMVKLKDLMIRRTPSLTSEFYLIGLDGKVEEIKIEV